jgi:carboxymethylenebutenolidase
MHSPIHFDANHAPPRDPSLPPQAPRSHPRRGIWVGGSLLLLGTMAVGWWFMSMPVPDERFIVVCRHAGTRSLIRVEAFLPSEAAASAEPLPAVLLLHGVEGPERYARAHFQTARRLNREGYAVFFVHYFGGLPYDDLWVFNESGELDTAEIESRCRADSPHWIAAVNAVLDRIASRDDIDSERIALEGFSLGEYVAHAAAAESIANPALADVCCVVGNWGAKFETTTFAPGHPPTFLVHGERDDIVPLAAADATLLAIESAGNEADLFQVPGAGHIASSVESLEATLSFLRSHLQKPALAISLTWLSPEPSLEHLPTPHLSDWWHR